MSKPKISTMKELSETIGVSRPTLSRYFQDPTSVRPTTSEKIMRGLDRVDYVYNFLATRQNRKTTGLIGVIVPHFNDLFFTSLLEAMERSARNLGFTLITQSANDQSKGEAAAVEKLRSMSVDGAIIAPLGVENGTTTLQNISNEIPIVFVDSQPSLTLKNADFVGTDNYQSINAMVDYLCRTGEPPVFLGMSRFNYNARIRENAYITRMQSHGFKPKIIENLGANESLQFEARGHDFMDIHFGQGHYTQATILCANDRLAIGAIRAANMHGLFGRTHETAGKLRIAGHDDYPLSRYMFPALTTVSQDIDDIGTSAVELLVARIRQELTGDPVTLLKTASLKIRESA